MTSIADLQAAIEGKHVDIIAIILVRNHKRLTKNIAMRQEQMFDIETGGIPIPDYLVTEHESLREANARDKVVLDWVRDQLIKHEVTL